jgi:predicted ATPase with chaperone activity
MPPLTAVEALELTAVHSVAGLLPADQGIIAFRPFPAPHHTVSSAGSWAAAIQCGLSARAYGKVLRVARTIADLEGSEAVGASHVAEAIQARLLDRDPQANMQLAFA